MVLAELLQNYGLSSEIATVVGGVLTFLIVFVLSYTAGRLGVVPLANRVLSHKEVDEHARKPLLKIVRYGMFIISILVALAFSGLGNLVSALATVGAAGTLAVGFAMKNTIENFVSGIFIYTDNPFEHGDWIEWNDKAGRVDDIGLRVTRITTFDNERLTVPNSELANATIKNPVANDTLRMRIMFGIGYEDDISEAMKIIKEEADAYDGIIEEPEPVVRLAELADSYVGLQAFIWIKNPSRPDSLTIKSDFQKIIKERFDEEGIEMPYPYTELTGGIEIEESGEVQPEEN